MTTTVHVHYYRGLAQLPKVLSTQFAADAVYSLLEPPLGGGANTIEVTASTLTAAPTGTEACRIEVADGGKVRYTVVNNSNEGAEADSDSPSITGTVVIHFNAGWSLSLIEAS